MKVKRAHTDSKGRRWQIGDVVAEGEHPDVKTHPWLFEAPKSKVSKPKE